MRAGDLKTFDKKNRPKACECLFIITAACSKCSPFRYQIFRVPKFKVLHKTTTYLTNKSRR